MAPLDASRFDDLIALAEPLARRPARELILAQLIDSASGLAEASALARERRRDLRARGMVARAAAFATDSPAADLVRIAIEQDVDLLLIEAPAALLEDETLRHVLSAAPCDVAVLVPRNEVPPPGPVLVPFTGAEHDWTAVELGAWIARSQRVSLQLAGPVESGRDASRLLARASLAVQRALGVDAEPRLLERGTESLVAAADQAALVVVGLTDRWQRDGLGAVRAGTGYGVAATGRDRARRREAWRPRASRESHALHVVDRRALTTPRPSCRGEVVGISSDRSSQRSAGDGL